MNHETADGARNQAENSPTTTIISHFSSLSDPRIEKKTRHLLEDIIVITICAAICGADDWVAVMNYGKDKYDWLKTVLKLPYGIPSHDTFGNLFAVISPTEFEECFLSWIRSVCSVTKGQVVAIDGKKLRRSHDKSSNKSALHMVSAWASENGVTLGQVRTDEKSNEITAIPELLLDHQVFQSGIDQASLAVESADKAPVSSLRDPSTRYKLADRQDEDYTRETKMGS